MRIVATIVLASVGIIPVLAPAQAFNSVDATHNLNYFNNRPMHVLDDRELVRELL